MSFSLKNRAYDIKRERNRTNKKIGEEVNEKGQARVSEDPGQTSGDKTKSCGNVTLNKKTKTKSIGMQS